MKNDKMIVIFLLIFTAAVFVLLCFSAQEQNILFYTEHTVKSRETLWGIAKESNGYGLIDTRDIVDEIIAESKIKKTIVPGQVVFVPQYDLEGQQIKSERDLHYDKQN